MRRLLSPFWNADEKRIRALWRILAQLALNIVLLFALVEILALAAGQLGHLEPGHSLVFVLKRWRPDIPFYGVLQKLAEMASAVGAAWIASHLLDKRPFARLGYRVRSRRAYLDLACGTLLGVVAIAAMLGFELAAGWMTLDGIAVPTGSGHTWAAWTFAALVACLFNGVEEETTDRAYFIHNAFEGFSGRATSARGALVIAWVLSAVKFGFAHYSPQGGLMMVAGTGAIGLAFAASYVMTGDLALAIGLHTGWNFAEEIAGNLTPPVPGDPTVLVLAVHDTGPKLWTGGTLGPEAGLVCGIGFFVVVIGTLVWARVTRRRVSLAPKAFVDAAASSETGPAEMVPATERGLG